MSDPQDIQNGTFWKLRKSTTSLVMSVCPSVHRPTLDGFSWNFIFQYFSQICRQNSWLIKNGQENRVFYKYICDNISL